MRMSYLVWPQFSAGSPDMLHTSDLQTRVGNDTALVTKGPPAFPRDNAAKLDHKTFFTFETLQFYLIFIFLEYTHTLVTF